MGLAPEPLLASASSGVVSLRGVPRQCAVIPLNIHLLGHAEVCQLAEMYRLHIRGGCFCNPGACMHMLRLSGMSLRVPGAGNKEHAPAAPVRSIRVAGVGDGKRN